ncbi:hypothetical protein Despr_0102 [Desulfobulbus propionicus DSM 2032]|uniref:Uncharacterized protein n=1 Tax=Desulfobulbus propionicus (strain ATCC 33891 / DSM 2032 / VKM B-1956 / 1pr3) TaxID=577650 RepID=A0A7U3YJ00_DESPD|nr:hypothetical protein [Desulfobulbus propionicus]ADW16296.1 hypothetical protein Despr_0102 [Desulfobulbus propionicus DSM 2032]
MQAANVLAGTTVTSATQAVDNDTTGAGDITLAQATGTSNISQAVNHTEAGTITALNQNINTVELVLGQTGGSKNSQVGNHAKALTNVTTLAQQTKASRKIDMDQVTGGDGNLQALNAAEVTKVSGTVSQTVSTGLTNIDLKQEQQTSSQQTANYLTSPGTVASVTQVSYYNSPRIATLLQDNTTTAQQALNFIEMTGGADKLTKGTQTVGLATLDMGQGETGANSGSDQAVNLLFLDDNLVLATQTVTADIDLTQAKGADNTQAVNSVSGKNITTKLTQTVTGVSDNMTQGGDGASNNFQAGNFLDVEYANGTIASVQQNYNATTLARMRQDGITSGVQGLNVIDASRSGVKVTSADQNVVVPALTMRQGESKGTATSVQAGNTVLAGSTAVGGKVDQDVLVATTLAMTQANATTSTQAANFTGNRPR